MLKALSAVDEHGVGGIAGEGSASAVRVKGDGGGPGLHLVDEGDGAAVIGGPVELGLEWLDKVGGGGFEVGEGFGTA